MRIVIPLASASRHLSGVQRHAINIARCLLTRSEVTSVHLVVSPWQQEFVYQSAPHGDARLHLHPAQIGSSALSRNLWYYQKFPQLAVKLEADIVHLAYPAPLNRSSLHCPAVVTLHDLYPYEIPENFGFPKVLFNRLVLRQCLRSADAVACVSRSTWMQLKRIEPKLAHEKGSVVANCVEPYLEASVQRPLPAWSGRPFLLCIAQHRRNKNILFLLRVFERLLRSGQIAPEMRLVIVGIEGPETKAILRFLDQARFADHVVLLSGISDRELQWSYLNCKLLLAPSSVEGFGLPVAEALLAGCRVICSDIPAFREVGGDHCLYIKLDADAERNFGGAVLDSLRLIRSPPGSLPPSKPINLPQLSAPVIAAKYLRLYKSLLLTVTANGRLPRASNQNSQKDLIL